jgi:hypothetical protein
VSVGTPSVVTLALQKTFAATTTSTKLLMVDWKGSTGGGTLVAIGDGVTLPLAAEVASPTSGYTRTYFYVAASSLAVTRFEWTSPLAVGSRTLSIDNVSVTNVQPSFGTFRQQMRSVTVTGSAPAPGSLAIESPTAALGNGVLVYTFPATAQANGYSPPLRQYRVGGGTVTTDATMVSGSRENADVTGVAYTIPNKLLPPGNYILMARLALSTVGSQAGTLTITSDTTFPSVGAPIVTTGTVALTETWTTFALARLALPLVDTAGQVSIASTKVTVKVTGGAFTVLLDEAWLFNADIGQLIQVNCGTGAGTSGGAARRLFIEPPTDLAHSPNGRLTWPKSG